MQDASEDRKYFTIIPNIVIDDSSGIAQGLYAQLKRIAGETGIAYPSRGFLMRKLKITKPTLIKYFKYLIDKKWIVYIGEVEKETRGGLQKLKGYRIVDIWEENFLFFKSKGVKNRPPHDDKGGKKYDSKGVKNSTRKKNPLNKNQEVTDSEESVSVPFSLEGEQKKLEDSNSRHLNIIALYLDFRKSSLIEKVKNTEQMSLFIRRHCKEASELSKAKYTDDQLLSAFKVVNKKNEDIEWTLGTVIKHLTK